MGLDTSHNCWSGAYSAFNRWRTKIAEVAGYGELNEYLGFDGTKPWPNNNDALIVLLRHSDCDGEINHLDCADLANRLESLLPALEIAGDGGGHIGSFAEKTKQFIDGLRDAAEAGENVDFH